MILDLFRLGGRQFCEINLNAQWVLAREFGRGMLARGSGKVIFTASLLSFQGGITVLAYVAAKDGVAQLAKALSKSGQRETCR